VASAQAADLPVKAKPVEYVKVCSMYGAGYWYVPGTDTCLKIGAFTRLEVEYGATAAPAMIGLANNGNGDGGGNYTRTGTNQFTYMQRAVVSFDMRTQTEYGTLRSYIDLGEEVQTGDSIAGASTQLGAATLYTSRAFLQFAGFTAGRMRSFFDMFFIGSY